MVDNGEIDTKGAVYDMDTGVVNFIKQPGIILNLPLLEVGYRPGEEQKNQQQFTSQY